MRRRFLFIIIICSFAMNIGFLASYLLNKISISNNVCSIKCHTNPDNYLYKFIGLKDDQVDKIGPIAIKFHNELDMIHLKITEVRNMLMKELSKKDISTKYIDEMYNEISSYQNKMQKLVINHIISMKEIMTEEQSRKFFNALNQSYMMKNAIKF